MVRSFLTGYFSSFPSRAYLVFFFIPSSPHYVLYVYHGNVPAPLGHCPLDVIILLISLHVRLPCDHKPSTIAPS
jgi:hypothetical protein